jgi:hypothetical protein
VAADFLKVARQPGAFLIDEVVLREQDVRAFPTHTP